MPKQTLREVLLARKQWNVKQLSARVSALRRDLPLKTSIAQAVVAHQEGINIAKYLDSETLDAARTAIRDLGGIATGPRARGPSPESRPTTRPSKQIAKARSGHQKQRTVIRLLDGYDITDPLLPPEILSQAQEMAASYAVLHVLENSIRNVIQLVLGKEYGTEWWGQVMKGPLKKVEEKAAGRKKKEGTARWHQSRGVHMLDYTDFDELGDIIRAKQEKFLPVLGVDNDWLTSFFKQVGPSRNVVCHMNRLEEHNITGVKWRAKEWRKILTEQKLILMAVPS